MTASSALPVNGPWLQQGGGNTFRACWNGPRCCSSSKYCITRRLALQAHRPIHPSPIVHRLIAAGAESFFSEAVRCVVYSALDGNGPGSSAADTAVCGIRGRRGAAPKWYSGSGSSSSSSILGSGTYSCGQSVDVRMSVAFQATVTTDPPLSSCKRRRPGQIQAI